MNHKVDDGNEMTLSFFPLPLITKYRLRGREWGKTTISCKERKGSSPSPHFDLISYPKFS